MQAMERIDFTAWNSYADPDFVFYDQNLVEKCQNRDPVSFVYLCVSVHGCVLMY